MKNTNFFLTSAAWIALVLAGFAGAANGQSFYNHPRKGPDSVVVHPKFGGTILGFDVDQNGSEGLLSEFNTVEKDGKFNCPYATESFDLATGKILKVVSEGEGIGCENGEVTWGVAGTSVGLVEHQHSPGAGQPLQMTEKTLDPLGGNKIDGNWTPPFDGNAYIAETSRNQGTANNAYVVYDVKSQKIYLFGSDVAKNTFGPVMEMAYPIYGFVGLDTSTDEAVLATATAPFGPSEVTLANLTTGKTSSFDAELGSGNVQGIAVDSEDDIAVVATFGDAGLTFYDLKNKTGFSEPLPFIPQNCDNACTADDVEYDPIHKLFLVAQPISSQEPNSNFSTIYAYNIHGGLQETLNGFQFTTARFDLFPVHIALHPSDRSGFVDETNDLGVGAIRGFTY
jgi:sugar lactone lactonase YvrE